jgi:hypothetical protein
MEKLATAIKQAEVNGFVGALVETGIIKVANEEEQAVIADVIAEHLPEDYAMEDALAVAADVVDALEDGALEDEEVLVDEDGMVVEASDSSPELNETALMAAYGELVMAKEAGEISAEDFEKEANAVTNMLRAGKGKVVGVGRAASSAMRNSLRTGMRRVRHGVANTKGRAQAAVGNTVDALKGNKKRLDYLHKRLATAPGRGEASALAAQIDSANRAVGRTRMAAGAVGVAGLGAGGLGANALYNKYNQQPATA